MAQAVPLPKGENETPEDPRPRFTWRPTDAFWVGGAALLLIGAWGLWQRLAEGLAPTNLTSYVPWGVWVGFYDYLVWVEVGSLMLFTGLVYIAGRKSLARLKPIVLLIGFAVLNMALLIVLFDLGHPERFWHVIIYPDFGSMITWMVWLHSSYVLVLSAEIFLVLFGGERGERPLYLLSMFSLPLGLALILVSGSIFGVVAARPLWNTASLPIMFLISSLATGSSLLLLVVVLFWPDKESEEYRETMRFMARLTAGLLLLGVFVASVIGATMLYKGAAPSRVEAITLILTGPYWWSFWIVHILLGVLIPLVVLLTMTENRTAVGIAATLSTITFVAVTLNIVIPVLVTPELAGLAEAFIHPKLSLNYAPNLMEWLFLAFVFGMGSTIIGLGLRFLPFEEKMMEMHHD